MAILAIQLLLASQAVTADRVIGLLTLPELYAGEECKPFEPRPVALFAEPFAKKETAQIRADLAGLPPNSGCQVYEADVHRGSSRTTLPTREYGYEAPAAIVLAQRDGWFKIRLSDGAAWVAPAGGHVFLPLSKLFDEALTALTDQFTGRLLSEPNGAPTGERWKEFQDVRVVEVRQVGDRQWIHVDVLSHSPCDANINLEPFAVGKGWLPAHSDSGEPTVWFSARGC